MFILPVSCDNLCVETYVEELMSRWNVPSGSWLLDTHRIISFNELMGTFNDKLLCSVIMTKHLYIERDLLSLETLETIICELDESYYILLEHSDAN